MLLCKCVLCCSRYRNESFWKGKVWASLNRGYAVDLLEILTCLHGESSISDQTCHTQNLQATSCYRSIVTLVNLRLRLNHYQTITSTFVNKTKPFSKIESVNYFNIQCEYVGSLYFCSSDSSLQDRQEGRKCGLSLFDFNHFPI